MYGYISALVQGLLLGPTWTGTCKLNSPQNPEEASTYRKASLLVIFVIFTLALVATAFIVYNFAACPRTDQLANVTKYELSHCDQNKLTVIPLSTDTTYTETNFETTTAAIDTTTEEYKVIDVRLPNSIKPDRYSLKLTPYIFEGNFTFDGEISVVITVKNETNRVTFHGVELDFHDIGLFKKEDGKAIKIKGRTEDVARQFHILITAEPLKAGQQYVLNITYTGILNDNLHGFYRSSYEEKKDKRWIAVTQFQATDARRAFPCWDEPALKARFTISIARPANMSSVSNMNIIGRQPHKSLENYIWDHYAESLPMSTYLVAFAVTDFGNMSHDNFSVWARKEALSSASYALDIGPQILKFLEEYYKIKFPLPKIDMVALPDFKAGAMENWGLLTFREIAMLYDHGVSPTTAKARVASVVAHEIAHQWFGNLVTPAWWSDIWLNEGFASYVEYVAVDAVEKTWKLMEVFVLNEVQSVFKLDALTSSHQISVEVGNPEEIGAIFDKISYGKGSAILRMMNHFLTDDVFNAGITDYLNAKKYGDAEQRDLWSALTNAAREQGHNDIDVAVIMDSWTLQTGFPVLNITRDYDTGAVTFSQERFILINGTVEDQKPVWWIPISYTTASEKDFASTQPKLWLRGERSVICNNISISKDDWIIANTQQTGFYRINYDQRNWEMLIKILNDPKRFEEIHPINRAQIIDDAMNLALSGRLDYRIALDITSYLTHERSYVPWKAGLVALGYIDSMLSKGAYYLEYQRYVLRLLSGAVQDLGWEVSLNESVVRAQHRVDLLWTACHLQQVDCLEHAVRMYTNWMLTPNPDAFNEIHADIRSTVYCIGVQAGGAREWNFAWDRFTLATSPSERELLLSVLGCTRAPYLLYRYLELSLRNDSGIRKQDTVRVFSAVASSSIGEPIAFNFVRDNWQRLKEFVGSVSTMNSILKVVTRRINQVHEFNELKRFVSLYDKELGRPVQQVLERTEANVQWMQRNYKTIVSWLLDAEKARLKMATLILILALAVTAHAIPTPPSTRNTIFIDEQLEGQIFDAKYFTESTATTDPSAYRLPTTTKPIHYDVFWVVDMARLTFSGDVTIQLAATQANVNEIVLHSNELDISSVELKLGNTPIVQTYELEPEFHFLKVSINNTVLQYNANNPVVYTLNIKFGAELRRDMYGLYRSWFKNSWNDTESWMATTQFQSTSSRSAFPCYDEPNFKATFKITIRRPSAYKSWSCTRIEKTNIGVIAGFDDDIYYITPKMSTYLIAVIVAEYDTKPLRDANGTLLYEVIARPGAMSVNQGDYSYDVGQRLLSTMSEHTDLDFFEQSPYLKMTQASIPDFSAGAMENWGLLTYREAYLMYDPEHTHDNAKQIIAYILSHEIAHMWFGNLVTCDWWGHTWLNEGFARYYQYFLTHWVEKDMGFDVRFIVEQVHTAMMSDSGNNPHPLSNPNVGSPSQASSMFSTLTYNKGAAIIRMTEHLLGFEVHRQGLRQYLVDNSYGNVLPIDLSQTLHNVSVEAGAISEYPGFSVVEYYKTWHDQPGVPVIYVDVNHKTGAMTITQRRFNVNTGYATVNYNWQIPLSFATASNPNFNETKPTHIMTSTVTVINRGTTGDEWVVFNKQQTGYYRVNYDEYTWNLIIIALRGADRTKIDEFNRAQIVDDVFQFARAGIMSYTRALNILSFLEYEFDYAPWMAALNGFSWLRGRLAGTPLLTRLESLMIKWATPVMNSLGYSPNSTESFMDAYLRRQMAPVMCNLGVEECLNSANSQFRALIDNSVEVPVNSRNWVYCNGLRSGSYGDFSKMWRRYIEHNVYSEKIQLLQTLGCTRLESALTELLTSLVKENFEIRPQDYSTTFNTALTGNEGNTQLVFNFIKSNLVDVEKAFGSVSSPLSSVASRLRTTEDIDAFQLWLNQTQTNLGDAYSTLYRAAESSRESLSFAQEIQNDLDNYLVNGDENLSPSTPSPVTPSEGSTVDKPGITAPPTPDLPGSAMTAMLSLIVVTFAAATNIVL
ncbi:unnamed protein product [Leptosia nina]|uniref:Aminopeptidase N n=1 Tax=Leptosia nina TaxID=320188 RepID=A0AAV1JCD0_9NEOP